jgi:hypothetical protein
MHAPLLRKAADVRHALRLQPHLLPLQLLGSTRGLLALQVQRLLLQQLLLLALVLLLLLLLQLLLLLVAVLVVVPVGSRVAGQPWRRSTAQGRRLQGPMHLLLLAALLLVVLLGLLLLRTLGS